jgi:hypothetical protein
LASCSNLSARRASRATAAPSATNRLAGAMPTPELAPVISTRLHERSPSLTRSGIAGGEGLEANGLPRPDRTPGRESDLGHLSRARVVPPVQHLERISPPEAAPGVNTRSSVSIIATLCEMPTDIYFGTENVSIRIDEDPNQVFDAWTAAQGLPFRLSESPGRWEVYVNPAMVAFWRAWTPRQEFETPPPHPPRTG